MTMTYTSLYDSVKKYIRRNDSSTLNMIPTFIEHAQYLLSSACKTIGQEDYIVSNFIPGVSVYQKPAGWRRSVSINVGSGVDFNDRNILENRVYEFSRLYTKNPADNTKWALPVFYSDYGYTNFLVAPTPDLAYPFEYCYMKTPNLITQQNQTNWWTNFAADTLLNATLMKAHTFLENFEKAAFYKGETKEGISAINDEDEMRKVDRNSARQAD